MSSSGKTMGAIEMVVGAVLYEFGGEELASMGAAMFFSGAFTELSLLLMPNPVTSGQDGIVRGSVANQQIVYGEICTGGVLCYCNPYGSNGSNTNAYLTVTIAHSLTRQNSAGTAGMPVEGIQGFYINDVFVPLLTDDSFGGWNAGRGEASGTGACSITQGVDDGSNEPWNNLAGNLWMSFSDGSQTTADPILTSELDVASTFIGYGISYSTWVLFMSADQGTFTGAFPNGLNTPGTLKVVIAGQLLYDPRLDSDNGGSGSQRLTDTTTWAFSSNPALILADYLTRLKNDGGCGYSPGTYSGSSVINSQVNWACVAAAANICDEEVSVPAYGATFSDGAWSTTVDVSTYSCNMAVQTNQNCDQNVADILKTMAGFIVVSGGQIYMYAGATTTSSGTLDETFLAGSAGYSPQIQRSQMGNAVKFTYGQEPQQDYNQAQGAPLTNSTYEADDGNVRLWVSDTIPGCNNQFQCQILERIALKKTRNKQVLNLVCNLKALNFKGGDVIEVNISELNLSDAPFRIMQYRLDNTNYTIKMMLVQENSGTYTLPSTPDGVYQAYNTPDYQELYDITPSAPGAPSSLTSSSSAKGILLNWTSPAPNTFDYQTVYRSSTSSSSGFTAIANVVGDSYLDSSAEYETEYWYYVTATNFWSQASPNSDVTNITMVTQVTWDSNLLKNATLATMDYWTCSASFTLTSPKIDITAAASGSPTLTATDDQGNTAFFPMNPNTPVSISVNLTAVTGTATVYPQLLFYEADKETFISSIFPTATSTDGVTSIVSYNCPSGTAYGAFRVVVNGGASGGTATLKNPTLRTGTQTVIDGGGAQLGSATTVRAVTSAGVGYYISGLTLTSPNPNKITASACTLEMGGSGTGNVSYNSSSVSGLTASTTYYLYYIDPGFQGGSATLNASTSKISSLTGSPDTVYLGFWETPASGSGGSGGTGGCLHPYQPVVTVEAPFKLADQLVVGDEVLTPDGTAPILSLSREPCSTWLKITIDRHAYFVTETQPFLDAEGKWIRAHNLKPGDALARGLIVQSIEPFTDESEKIILNVAEPHAFLAYRDGAILHNGAGKP
ncbi:MAG: Hint domain-containing protein [Gammaproteobacteria bacterium]